MKHYYKDYCNDASLTVKNQVRVRELVHLDLEYALMCILSPLRDSIWAVAIDWRLKLFCALVRFGFCFFCLDCF